MRRTTAAVLSLVAAALCGAIPALAQLPALRDRPLSAAERTRLSALESQLARVSQQRSVSVAAVRAIAQALGERLTSQDPDQLIRAIDERAQELGAARGRISQLERDLEAMDSMRLAQAVGPLLTAAGAAIEQGQLGAAEARLAEAAQRFADARVNLQGRVDQLGSRQADILAQQAAVRAARFDWRGAATLYAEAAQAAPPSEPAIAWRLRLRQADMLRLGGVYVVEPEMLVEATSVVRDQALPLAPRETRPVDWANTQVVLARMLAFRAQENGDAAALAESLVIARGAVEVRPPLIPAEQFAENEAFLGSILASVAEEAGDRAGLEEAVTLLRRGLANGAPSRAGIQEALSTTLSALAPLSANPDALLGEAVAAARAAITGIDQANDPARWGRAQVNLGLTLVDRAERTPSVALWTEAAAEVRAGLAALPRERYLGLWRWAATSLATTLASLSEAQGLGAGDAAYAEALSLFDQLEPLIDRAETPLDWADLRQGRGDLLFGRGRLENDPVKLGQALAAHRDVLTVLTAPDFAARRAEAQARITAVEAEITRRRNTSTR